MYINVTVTAVLWLLHAVNLTVLRPPVTHAAFSRLAIDPGKCTYSQVTLHVA